MKLRTFYSEYSSMQFKKQLWIMGLVAFFLFLILPVALVIDVGNMEHAGYTLYERQREFTLYVLRSKLLLLAVMASGFFIAVYQFCYLHSRRKVDFFHSFPVRKEKIYWLHVGSAYLDFVIPFTAAILAGILLGLSRGLATWEAIGIYGFVWLFYQIVFLVSYGAAAVAMLLTGREFVGIIGAMVLLFIPVIMSSVITWYQSEFFQTYSGLYKDTDWFLYLSPGCTPWMLRVLCVNLFGSGKFFSIKFMILMLLTIVFAIAFLFLGCYLMKKRPSEAAGSSMVFVFPARVIHVLLSMIGALYAGLFVYSIAGYYIVFWLFAGVSFGGLVLYILIQFIYTMDFRKVFQYKWQFVLVEAAALLVSALFCFDWIGYDTYIPKKEDLYSVAISIPDDYHYQTYYIDDTFLDGQEYRLDEMNLIVTDELYQMLEETVAVNGLLKEGKPLEADMRTVQVRYKLKNGNAYDRAYRMNVSKYRREFISLYDQAEFRDNMMPMYGLFTDDSTYELHLNYENDSIQLFGNDQQKALEFVHVLKRDFEQRKGSTFVDEIPIASVRVNSQKLRSSHELFVYPSSSGVIAYLEESGYSLESKLTVENILKIEVYDSRILDEKAWMSAEHTDLLEAASGFAEPQTISIDDWKSTDTKYTIYTDADKIAQMIPALIEPEYASMWIELCENLNVTVTYIGKDGYQVQREYSVLADRLPEFLKH